MELITLLWYWWNFDRFQIAILYLHCLVGCLSLRRNFLFGFSLNRERYDFRAVADPFIPSTCPAYLKLWADPLNYVWKPNHRRNPLTVLNLLDNPSTALYEKQWIFDRNLAHCSEKLISGRSIIHLKDLLKHLFVDHFCYVQDPKVLWVLKGYKFGSLLGNDHVWWEYHTLRWITGECRSCTRSPSQFFFALHKNRFWLLTHVYHNHNYL